MRAAVSDSRTWLRDVVCGKLIRNFARAAAFCSAFSIAIAFSSSVFSSFFGRDPTGAFFPGVVAAFAFLETEFLGRCAEAVNTKKVSPINKKRCFIKRNPIAFDQLLRANPAWSISKNDSTKLRFAAAEHILDRYERTRRAMVRETLRSDRGRSSFGPRRPRGLPFP